jgi:hypothetical protein
VIWCREDSPVLEVSSVEGFVGIEGDAADTGQILGVQADGGELVEPEDAIGLGIRDEDHTRASDLEVDGLNDVHRQTFDDGPRTNDDGGVFMGDGRFVGRGGGRTDHAGDKQASEATHTTEYEERFHGRALTKDMGPPRKYRDAEVSHRQLGSSTINEGEFSSRGGVQRL